MDSKTKVKIVEEKWPDSKLKSRTSFKDQPEIFFPQKHGLEEKWYSDGQLRERTNWVDGRLFGLSEEWYENGKPRLKTIYQGENIYSPEPMERWDMDGVLLEKRTVFPDGKFIYEEWYENGKPKSRKEKLATPEGYVDHGKDEEWRQDGTYYITERLYGKWHGINAKYDKNGNLINLTNFQDNMYHGISTNGTDFEYYLHDKKVTEKEFKEYISAIGKKIAVELNLDEVSLGNIIAEYSF